MTGFLATRGVLRETKWKMKTTGKVDPRKAKTPILKNLERSSHLTQCRGRFPKVSGAARLHVPHHSISRFCNGWNTGMSALLRLFRLLRCNGLATASRSSHACMGWLTALVGAWAHDRLLFCMSTISFVLCKISTQGPSPTFYVDLRPFVRCLPAIVVERFAASECVRGQDTQAGAIDEEYHCPLRPLYEHNSNR